MLKKTKTLIATSLLGAMMSPLLLADDTLYAEEVQYGRMLTIYHSADCDINIDWIKDVQSYGINVAMIKVDDIQGRRDNFGAPKRADRCSVGFIGDYYVDGPVDPGRILDFVDQAPSELGLSAD